MGLVLVTFRKAGSFTGVYIIGVSRMNTDAKPDAVPNPASTFFEEKAFRSRTVLVFGQITDALAADTVRRLLALDT